MVFRRHAGVDAQLFRTGCVVAGETRSSEEPVLHDGAGVGPGAAGADGHGGHGHRFPGVDYRRLQRDAPGDSTGLPASPDHRAHQRAHGRPNLHSPGQLELVCGDRAGGGDVPLVEQPGGGLRHCGDHRHADHHDTDLLRDPLCVEAPPGAVHHCDGGLLRDRFPVLRIEPAEATRRRLVPADDRWRGFHADDHVEGRASPDGSGAARRFD